MTNPKRSRLEILTQSLEKKEAELERRLDAHFDDVKRANGQPLNDKRNGQATINRWEKQSYAIKNQKESIEKTKAAIEREENKRNATNYAYECMPQPIKELIDDGVLTIWRKHPNTMFVCGIKKARISYRKGKLVHKYAYLIEDDEQYDEFMAIFNTISDKLKNGS